MQAPAEDAALASPPRSLLVDHAHAKTPRPLSLAAASGMSDSEVSPATTNRSRSSESYLDEIKVSFFGTYQKAVLASLSNVLLFGGYEILAYSQAIAFP